MAVIGIRYDEGSIEKGLGYQHVYLTLRTGKRFEFNSGDFPKDWFMAKKKYIHHADNELFLSHSSSVDHFIMDGAEFDSAWLVWNEKDEDPELVYKQTDDGWEMFVPKDTKPTWESHKKNCKK